MQPVGWIGAVVATFAIAWSSAGQGGDPAPQPRPFAISRETTYYTAPVRADGTIDYVEAINARLSRGATRDNNAAIPLLDALTRGRGDRVAHYAKVWDKLGGPPTGPHAKEDLGNATPNEPAGADLVFASPWTADKAPDVAKWVASWNPRLDLVVEASRRSHYYRPLVREHPEDSSAHVLLPHLNSMRGMINALKARALLELGNEDMEAFVRDVLAIVRISRLSGHAPTLVERLVALGCENVGLDAIRIAATGGWLSAGQVDQILTELRAVPAGSMYEAFEMGERSFMLEFLQTAAAHGPREALQMLNQLADPGRNRDQAAAPPPPVDPAAKDWNAALRKANAWYDRLEQAGRQPTYAQRRRATEAIGAELDEMRARQAGWRGPFTPLEDRALVRVLPTMNRAYRIEAWTQSKRVMTETSLALSSFRAKTGEYPATLRELAPAYFKSEPIDPLTDQPPIYRTEGAGYELRSVGPDGRPDDGPKSDDLVLRAER